MISIGGLPFDLASGLPFSQEELALIAAHERMNIPLVTNETFLLERVADRPWTPSRSEIAPVGGPARLHTDGDRIRVAHEEVVGEIDVAARRGTYARFGSSPAPLRIMLRTACTAMLPLHGAIPLHSSAVIAGDEALVFFGMSGAGKSTTAALSQLPLISDELVAITVAGGEAFARPTGFARELHADSPEVTPIRVAAFVQLAKAPQFSVTPLHAAAAMPELLKMVLSPSHPLIWNRVIAALGALLATRTPLLRMAWAADRSPVPQLLSALESLQRETGESDFAIRQGTKLSKP